jgi:ORF6N domain-containing protein
MALERRALACLMHTESPLAVVRLIVTIRGLNVILSSALARIYGVEPKVLNQAVKRNAKRFPVDFAFRLRGSEVATLQGSRSQSVTLKRGAASHSSSDRSATTTRS